ncbi:X2-like carbohydrate binding domain-containing protein [Gorillibacterium sp. sgz5001074]|uniref:X2-like carbohydrate binding domain-containing protein n=1 Tax=Gorillibacterium sp. sgz5001074 TaxID=3446695 RepID=UPI003F6701DF
MNATLRRAVSLFCALILLVAILLPAGSAFAAAPVFTGLTDKQVDEGTSLGFTVHADEPSGGAVTYKASGLPEGAAFNQTTGLFNWLPGYEQAGPYTVTFAAYGGGSVTQQNVLINVKDVPTANVRSGLKSLRTDFIDSNHSYSRTVAVTEPEGTELVFSAWIKMESADSQMIVKLTDTNTNGTKYVFSESSHLPLTYPGGTMTDKALTETSTWFKVKPEEVGKWVQLKWKFPLRNTGKVFVEFKNTNIGVGKSCYIDDVFLGLEGGVNKLTNPGFESGTTGWSVFGSKMTINDESDSNSYISPTSATFDKALGLQQDVSVTISESGNTLSAVKYGILPLTAGTDYTVSGNTVTIKKAYLATLPLGSASLIFDFNKGLDRTLALSIVDSSTPSSDIAPVSAKYDKNPAASSNHEPIQVTMALNGNHLNAIKNGSFPLKENTDYTVTNGTAVTLQTSYLDTLAVGQTTLTFDFDQGADRALGITVSDSRPVLGNYVLKQVQNNVINSGPYQAVTGLKTDGTKYRFSVKIRGEGKVAAKLFPSGWLPDFVSPNPDVISADPRSAAWFTATPDWKTVTFAGDFTSNDTSTVIFLMKDPANNGAVLFIDDISLFEVDIQGNPVGPNLVRNGNFETGDMTGWTHRDSSSAGSHSAYLWKTGEVIVTPNKSEFDLAPAYQSDITFTLMQDQAATPLKAIKYAGATLAAGTDYSVLGNAVTIKKSYMSTHFPKGLRTLTFEFASGAPQDVPIDVLFTLPPKGGWSAYQAERGTITGGTVEADSFASNGRVVTGLDEVGDSITFTNVEGGNTLGLRYANAQAAGGQISVYVNGAKRGSIIFGSTGAWLGSDEAYADAVGALTIPKGATVKLQVDPGDSALAVDCIRVYYNFEAETLTRAGSGTVASDSYASGGMTVAGIKQPGDRVIAYSPVEGDEVAIGYAALSRGKIGLYVNDVRTDLNFDTTYQLNGKGSYKEMSVYVPVPVGAKVAVRFDDGDTPLTLDYIKIVPKPTYGPAYRDIPERPMITGVYIGNDYTAVNQFETWLGNPDVEVLGYNGNTSWDDFVQSEPWIINTNWSKMDNKVLWSVSLIPKATKPFIKDSNLDDAARGKYNEYYKQVAQTIYNFVQDKGYDEIHIRTAWEFNADWFPWGTVAKPGENQLKKTQDFIGAWRQFYKSFKEVSPKFRIEWCANVGDPRKYYPDLAYPGDDYVDIIGMDVYDETVWSHVTDTIERFQFLLTRPYGLIWHREFAKAHHKPMAYSEWGVGGNSAGDSPYMVEMLYKWFKVNKVVQQTLWDSDVAYTGRLSGGQYPKAGAKYKELYGVPQSLPNGVNVPGDVITAISYPLGRVEGGGFVTLDSVPASIRMFALDPSGNNSHVTKAQITIKNAAGKYWDVASNSYKDTVVYNPAVRDPNENTYWVLDLSAAPLAKGSYTITGYAYDGADNRPAVAKVIAASASFNKNAPADVTIMMSQKGSGLAAVRNGTSVLVKGTDYTIYEEYLTITKSYLATLAGTKAVLTLDFATGEDKTVDINITGASAAQE